MRLVSAVDGYHVSLPFNAHNIHISTKQGFQLDGTEWMGFLISA